jgi:hypothetical protein
MTSQDDIAHQQTLLKTYRARLKILLNQQATFGAFVPPYILLEINDVRTQIRHIKSSLRGRNVSVEDFSGDEPPPDAS